MAPFLVKNVPTPIFAKLFFQTWLAKNNVYILLQYFISFKKEDKNVTKSTRWVLSLNVLVNLGDNAFLVQIQPFV